jgi:predicted porin
MQKHYVLAALTGAAVLASGASQAQTVTIYGVIDLAAEYISKTPTANGDKHLKRLNTGGISPSILGFKGSEDLGGGLRAVFNLEHDIAPDTGGARFADIGFWGRQANVGLSGDFGTVLLGRQYSPAILTELGTDPRGYKESYSMLAPYAFSQAPDGNAQSGSNFLGIFLGNSISYTNSFGPATLRMAYSLGEVAGGGSQRSAFAAGVSLAQPIVASLSYQQIRGLDDAKTTRVGLGAAAPLGPVTLKALYARSEGDDATGARAFRTDMLGIGADFAWNATNTANLSYYRGKDKLSGGGKSSSFVLSNDLALSKRTILYAHAVFVDIDNSASVRTQITAGVTPNGEKATVLGVGIKHAF